MLLKNKTAVITGAGRGIGRSIAICFGGEGADIALIARNTKEIDQVADDIKQIGRKALAVAADVSNEEAVLIAFKNIYEYFGNIDILVNNAGVDCKRGFVEMSLEEWDETMNINARSVVICTKAVLPDMLKKGKGNIVNISSGAGLRGLPGSAAYGASKAAMIALSTSIADEIRDQGIRVNVICPGPIKTEMLNKETLENKTTHVQLPEDVAGMALFAASPLSGTITGQVFSVRNTNRW